MKMRDILIRKETGRGMFKQKAKLQDYLGVGSLGTFPEPLPPWVSGSVLEPLKVSFLITSK
jgi:hypothetical protein